jgi:hypothetical protein
MDTDGHRFLRDTTFDFLDLTEANKVNEENQSLFPSLPSVKICACQNRLCDAK